VNLQKKKSTGDPPHLRSLEQMRWVIIIIIIIILLYLVSKAGHSGLRSFAVS